MALDTPTRARRQLRTAPPVAVALGAAVLAQVSYPLLSGTARDVVTVLIVVLVAVAALAHAALTRGALAFAALATATVAGGFAVEVVGVHTGLPFGDYRYSASLGPAVLGVPLVIAFAWTMLAWPAALVAARLCQGFAARVAVGAWALASYDLFLDPQMVAAGHWRWFHPSPHLPGVPAVPLSDYAGWFVVGLVMSLVLQVALRRTPAPPAADDRVMVAFYVWTWASSTLALAAFLDLAAAAAWGFLAMGAVVVAVVRSRRGRL